MPLADRAVRSANKIQRTFDYLFALFFCFYIISTTLWWKKRFSLQRLPCPIRDALLTTHLVNKSVKCNLILSVVAVPSPSLWVATVWCVADTLGADSLRQLRRSDLHAELHCSRCELSDWSAVHHVTPPRDKKTQDDCRAVVLHYNEQTSARMETKVYQSSNTCHCFNLLFYNLHIFEMK